MRLFILGFFLVICTALASQSLRVAQVVKAFKSAGLEVIKPTTLEPSDLHLAPVVGEEAVHFFIPSVCLDCGGRIFAVNNNADRIRLRDYYVNLGKQSAMFYSWVFVHKNIVVQINGDMKRAQAEKYRKALERL